MKREGVIEAEAMEVAIEPKNEQQSCSHPALNSTLPDIIKHTGIYCGPKESEKVTVAKIPDILW